MADEIRWDPDSGYRGYDIHIVRQGGQPQAGFPNSTKPLRPMVAHYTKGKKDPPAPPPTIGPTFSTVPPNINTETAKYGVSVTDDAAVNVDFLEPPLLGGLRLRNFLIIATEGTLPSIVIRVHVHLKRDTVVLSPSTLTVRADDGPMAFSVLAIFDDAVGADISFHPGITWGFTGTGFSVDATTGNITATAETGGGTVTVTLPDELGRGTATANVEVGKKWSTLAGTAKLIRSGGPGVSKRDGSNVRNVILLPEGFSETEQWPKASDPKTTEPIAGSVAFDRLANEFVHTMTSKGGKFAPYNLVKGSFNFFSLWIPPPTAPVTPP